MFREKFEMLIKDKGDNLPRQHRNKEFRAAVHWFHELGAITEEELNGIERIYMLRNDIVHQIFRIIADDNKDRTKWTMR